MPVVPLRVIPALCALALVACGSSSAAGTRSGISGTAVVAPTCPVERVGQMCSRPYATTLLVVGERSHRVVARVRTSRSGRFRVPLAPGRYVLRGARAGLPRWEPRTVVVVRGRYTRVTYTFDTGIR